LLVLLSLSDVVMAESSKLSDPRPQNAGRPNVFSGAGSGRIVNNLFAGYAWV